MNEIIKMITLAKNELLITITTLLGTGKVIIGTAIAVPTFGVILVASKLLSKNKR